MGLVHSSSYYHLCNSPTKIKTMRLKLILLWFILYGVLGVNGIVESIFNKIMPWNTKKHPEKDGDNYGVDVTTPIHHYLDENSQYGKIYNDFMEGCYAKYSRRECDMTEEQRIAMNLNQPRMQYNYTETGFLKMKVPESVWSIIKEFYDRNKHLKSIENWPRGNTYVNHWNNPTEFVSVENTALVGGGDNLKLKIWNGIKPVLEDWVDQELTPTSLYGIRIYRGGATLSTRKLEARFI